MVFSEYVVLAPSTNYRASLYENGRADLTEVGTERCVASGSWAAVWAAARLLRGQLTVHWVDWAGTAETQTKTVLTSAAPSRLFYDGETWRVE